MNEANDVAVSLRSVHVYPVKSCAGTTPRDALLAETGFDLDRSWMVTDPDFGFVTQRELPRLALVQPTLKSEEMILRAPGMLGLHVALDRVDDDGVGTRPDGRHGAIDLLAGHGEEQQVGAHRLVVRGVACRAEGGGRSLGLLI